MMIIMHGGLLENPGKIVHLPRDLEGTSSSKIDINWLVVWNMAGLFFHSVGFMSSSHL
jgi:hypothetical protein